MFERALLLSCASLLAACQAADIPAQPRVDDAGKARAEVLAPLDSGEPRSIEHTRWTLVSLDGRPAVAIGGSDRPYLQFANGYAGGASGCNAFGGLFVRVDGGLHFGDIVANQMGCQGAVGEQEEALFALLRSKAEVGFPSGDRMTLSMRGHVAELSRAADCPTCDVNPRERPALHFKPWVIYRVDGAEVPGVDRWTPGDFAVMRFVGNRYSWRLKCDTHSGSFSAAGDRLIIGHPARTHLSCSAADRAKDADIRRFLAREPRFAADPNGAMILANEIGSMALQTPPSQEK